MAKVTIMGNALVVTSAIKFEDIKTLAKYRPAALTLKGGEDGKEPVFQIRTGTKGEISTYGAIFTGEARDGSGLAVLTMGFPYDGDNVKGAVADKIGTGLANLNKLEATLDSALEGVKEEREAIIRNIEVQ